MAFNTDKYDILFSLATEFNDTKLKTQLSKIKKEITKAQDTLKINIADENALNSLQKYEKQFNLLNSILSVSAKKIEDLKIRFAKLGQDMPKFDDTLSVEKNLKNIEKNLKQLETTYDKFKEKAKSLNVELSEPISNNNWQEQTKVWQNELKKIERVQSNYKFLQDALKQLNIEGKISQPDLKINEISEQLKIWKNELKNFEVEVKGSNAWSIYKLQTEAALTGLGQKITTFTKDGISEMAKLSEAGKQIGKELYADFNSLTPEQVLDRFSQNIAKNRFTGYDNETLRETFKLGINEIVAKETDKLNSSFAKLNEEIKKNKATTIKDLTSIAESVGMKFNIGDIVYDEAGEFHTAFTLITEDFQKIKGVLNSYTEIINKGTAEEQKYKGISVSSSTTVSDASNSALKEYSNNLNKIYNLELKLEKAKKEENISSQNVLNQEIQKLQLRNKELVNGFKALGENSRAYKEYQNIVTQYNNKKKVDLETQELTRQKNELNNLIQKYKEYNSLRLKTYTSQAKREDTAVITSNFEQSKKAYKEYQDMVSKANLNQSNHNKLIEETNKLNTELRNSQTKVTNEIEKTNSIFGKLKTEIKNVTVNVLAYRIAWQGMAYISTSIRESIQLIKELDEAMTNIRMVTGETQESVENTINTYAELGKELGATTRQVAEGSIEWLRQGFTVEETAKLLESSTKLSKLGMIESATATELMTATLNGFNLSAQESESIVDKLVRVDLDYATSAQEIATALQYTASSAKLAEVSLDEMIGMITVVSATTRRSAETIGQSFKTIFSRLQNVAAGKELDDEGEKLNDVEKRLNSLGISLRDSIGEWRDMSEVLNEVGTRWDEFNSVEKAAITTAIAGTRQRENLLVVFEHWDEVLKATEISQNAAGTSAQKYEIYMESLEAKINQFIATWEQLVNNLGQSDTFKGIVDFGTDILEFIDKFKVLQGLVLGGAFFGSIATGNKIIKTLTGNFGELANTMSLMKGVTVENYTAQQALQTSLSLLSSKQQALALNTAITDTELRKQIASELGLKTTQEGRVLAITSLTAQQKILNVNTLLTNKVIDEQIAANLGLELSEEGRVISLGNLTRQQMLAKISSMGLTKEQEAELISALALQGANYSLAASFKALWVSITASPLFPFVALAAGIAAVAKVTDWLTESFEELSERVAETENQYNDIISTLQNLNSELETTESRIKELEDKENLTIVEQTELEKLKETNNLLNQQISAQEKLKKIKKEQLGRETLEKLDYKSETIEINSEDTFYTGNQQNISLTRKEALEYNTKEIKNSKDLKKALEEENQRIAEKINNLQLSNIALEKESKTLEEHSVELERNKRQRKENEKSIKDLEKEIELNKTKIQDVDTEITEIEKKSGDYIQSLTDDINNLNLENEEQRKAYDNTMSVVDAYYLESDAVSYLKEQFENLANVKVNNPEEYQKELEKFLIKIANNDTLKETFNEKFSEIIDEDTTKELFKALTEESPENIADNLKEPMQKALDILDEEVNPFILEVKPQVDEGDLHQDLKKVAESAETLGAAYKQFTEEGSISAATFLQMQKDFAESVPNYQEYENALMRAGNTAEDVNDILNKLNNEYLNSSDFLSQLNEENKNYVIKQLEANGVTNTADVVNAKLAQKQARLTAEKILTENATIDLANATLKEVNQLINEKGTSEELRKELARLALEKLLVNKNKINTQGDIEQLINLANTAGATIASLQQLELVKNILNPFSNMGATSGSPFKGYKNIDLKAYSEAAKTFDQLKNGTFKIEYEQLNPADFMTTNYANVGDSGDDDKSGSKGSGSEEDPWKEAFEKEKAELEFLRDTEQITNKEYYDGLNALVNKYYANNSNYIEEYRTELLELYSLKHELYEQERADIDSQIEDLSKQSNSQLQIIELIKKKQNSLHTEAEELRSRGVRETSDSIKDLQSQYKEATDEILSYIEDILDKNIEGAERFKELKESMGTWTEKDDISMAQDMLAYIEQHYQTYKYYYDQDSDAYNELIEQKIEWTNELNDAVLNSIDKQFEAIDNLIERTQNKFTDEKDNILALTRQKWAILEQAMADYTISFEEYSERRKEIIEQERDIIENAYNLIKEKSLENIDNQISSLEDQIDKDNEYYDEKIQHIQDIIDAMDEEEEKENKLLDLEEKRQALAKAESQKTSQIYREGEGFVWESNADDVKSAEQDYNDAIKEYNNWQKKLDLEGQIEDFEKAKEENEKNIQEQIDSLNELRKKWEESMDMDDIFNKYELSLFSLADNESLTFDERMAKVDEFRNHYINAMKEIENANYNMMNNLSNNQSKTWYVNQNGQAPSQAQIGDRIVTNGGTYEITTPYAPNSKYNPETGRWSIKLDEVSNIIQENQWGQEKLSDNIKDNSKIIDKQNNIQNVQNNILSENTSANNNLTESNFIVSDSILQNNETINNNTNTTEQLIESNNNLATEISNISFGSYGGGSSSRGGGSSGSSGGKQYWSDGSITFVVDNVSDVYNDGNYNGGHLTNVTDKFKKAKGTLYSEQGRHLVDEKGEELIIRPPSSGRYTYLEKGTGVIPADITKNLWEMGTNPHQFFEDELKNHIDKFNNVGYNISNGGLSLVIGDINVQGVQDVEGLSQAIITKLPNQIIKDLYTRK